MPPSHQPFLSLDNTFWIQLLNFAIFFALLNGVFLRPVGAAIKKRRAHIDGAQSDYERYAHQIRTLRSDADGRRAAARRAADETIAAARAAAESEAESELAGRTTEAEAIVEQARATVALELSVARGRQSELSRNLARTLLERAVGGDS
jgi:F0F1-type ATP synthase membrane subunit b/b'